MLYLLVSPYNHCLWNGGKRRHLYLVSIIHACLKTALLPPCVSNKGLGHRPPYSVYTGTQQWIGIFTSLQFFEHTQVVITFSPGAWQIKSSIMYLFFERVSNVSVLVCTLSDALFRLYIGHVCLSYRVHNVYIFSAALHPKQYINDSYFKKVAT